SECLEASKYTTIPSCTSLMKQLKNLESYDAEWVKNEISHWYGIFSFQLASDKNHDDGSGEDDIRPIKRKKIQCLFNSFMIQIMMKLKK
ncbi:1168_t:CDS:2, partial [Entrophospora sp. SA101]